MLSSPSGQTLRRPITTVPAGYTRTSAPASASGLLGAKVCSPSSTRGRAGLGLGHIVEVNDSHAGVQYYSGYAAGHYPNVTFSWHLDSSSFVVVGPSEKLERHLAKQGIDCWAVSTGNGSSWAAQTLSSVQQRVDRAVYEGAWHRNCGRTRTVGERESTEEGSNPSVVPPVYPLEPGSSAGTEREPPIVRYSPEYQFGDAIRPRGIPMPPSTNTDLTGR